MTTHTPADQSTIVEMMRDQRFCMLTTFAPEGELHSHPMTPQRIDDDGDVWCFIDGTSESATNLIRDIRVNLAFGDSSTWLSVAGSGVVLDDRDKIADLWNPMVEAWYPEGAESPDVRLLRVEPVSAQFWDTPGGRVTSALSFVRSKITGDRPAGHSGTVEMGGE
ncbi:pyridoxamine 5'-phosphate oxidase family protein [Nocardioides sp. JQ2195]|uniref:pyridoxamine 5'-phosphate oxidase family protein n=1 Tax=Nocardioides sp. JQ2195 TaxID=2592334 RepID=UPI00143E110F|nr:pyridoxamine 5'-phosphate oxidase family protein [Nocardioides sp. JQ2195]QIX26664.1 pyridoxamine 5'-phosphate oxidase family protein [Nocardioides sp. JQ2195]